MKESKIVWKVSNLIAAGLMIFFSIPKLIGVEKSRMGFEQFKSLVPLDPNVFRIFTGSIELFIALLIILYTIKNNYTLGKIAYFSLLATMIGGLIMEFFARPQPDMMLVVIAIILSLFSMYRLNGLLKK